jgi:DnaJ-class molecular chaperone
MVCVFIRRFSTVQCQHGSLGTILYDITSFCRGGFYTFLLTRGMVMFSSNDRCCFRRLGIERESTEREIKQAFRQLARESHPHMYTKPTEKERATVAFRALTANSSDGGSANDNGDQYHGAAREQNRNARTASNSDVRKAFQDICDELDRARKDKQRERDSLLTRSIKRLDRTET